MHASLVWIATMNFQITDQLGALQHFLIYAAFQLTWRLALKNSPNVIMVSDSEASSDQGDKSPSGVFDDVAAALIAPPRPPQSPPSGTP